MPDYKSLILKKLKGRRQRNVTEDLLCGVVNCLMNYNIDVEDTIDLSRYIFGKFRDKRSADSYSLVLSCTLLDIHKLIYGKRRLCSILPMQRCLRTLLES